LESCIGGLVYSEDLQTCDWPHNVPCTVSSGPNISDESEEEDVNIAIESKKDNPTNYREPRKQDGAVNQENLGSSRTKVGKMEVLRNLDEDLLDSLSPQPSIVSAITHGLQNQNAIPRTGSAKETKVTSRENVKFENLIIKDEEKTTGSQDFGERSEQKSVQNSFEDKEYVEYSDVYDSERIYTDSQISEIEKALLANIPGVSKHLDDSHHDDDNDFYYAGYTNPIYDEFQDYDDPEDSITEEDRSSQFVSRVSENQKVKSKTEEILLDHSYHPERPQRVVPTNLRPGDPAVKCDQSNCQLPDCRCGGPQLPLTNHSVKDIPQLVVLTFDDSINDLNQRLYESIFHPIRRNPNGCPISSTFYVSHEWTDYGHVQNMYSDGHEIASHSISHSFGEQFSKKKWLKEMVGQREILSAYGGVKLEDIRGMRAPFLAIGGNHMFSMLYDANFTYDSSMPIYENRPPSYPYTMDHKIFHECMIPPCPTRSFPGLWEIPLVMWNDLKDGRCSMADACSNPSDAEGVYLMIMQNFQRHYQTNRAPFGLFYHPAWFTTPHHKEGFELFLDTVTAMEDVWLVSSWQTIQWMRNPAPLSEVNNFPPFQCNTKNRPPRCKSPKVCNLWHKSGVRYMRTCQQCPTIYPWTGRTGISNSLVDNL